MSSRAFCAVLVVFVGVFMLTSCQAWKKTRQTWQERIYSEQVELNEDSGLSASEEEAAKGFAKVDQGLYELLQELQVQEDPPAEGWAGQMQEAHPWLQGLMVMDREGEELQSTSSRELPEDMLQDVLELEQEWQEQGLRLLLRSEQDQDWMIIVRPYHQGLKWQGLILAYFKPRDLLQGSESPGQIILLGQEQVLWSGDYPKAAEEALELDLHSRLEDQAYGQLQAAGQEFFWLARYVGQDQFFYLLAK